MAGPQTRRLDTAVGPLVTSRWPVTDVSIPVTVDAAGTTYALTLGDFHPLRTVSEGMHPATRSEVDSLLGLSTLDRVALRDGTTLIVLAVGETGPETHEVLLEAAFRLPSATADEPGRKPTGWIVALLGGVAAVFVVGALVLGLTFVDVRSEVARLEADGTRAEAQVVATETTRTRAVSQLRRTGWIDTTTHVVRFRYSTGSGPVLTDEQIVEPALFETAVDIGIVEVTYLPDDPRTVRVTRPNGSIPHPRHGPILAVTAVLAVASGWVLQRYVRTGVIS